VAFPQEWISVELNSTPTTKNLFINSEAACVATFKAFPGLKVKARKGFENAQVMSRGRHKKVDVTKVFNVVKFHMFTCSSQRWKGVSKMKAFSRD
jgi:hypothetical protein